MEVVMYSASVKTDKEKLFADYSLIEQMRLEHNKVAANFRSRLALEPMPKDAKGQEAKRKQGFIRDWCPKGFMLADTLENNSLRAKFRVYAHESKARQKQLLAERNQLIESIRWANYTPEQWKAIGKLEQDEQIAVYQTLFGNRAAEKVKPTKATSSILDELKALNLDDMPEKLGSDPTEDFTTYTETDPSSDITKTADRITFTTLQSRSDTFHVLYDKGVAHFDGDFEHLEKIYASLLTAGCIPFIWLLANMVGDFKDIADANEDALAIYWYSTAGTYSLTLDELDGGTEYIDTSVSLSISTIHFLENERDEAIGTYGTAYSYICTGDYWDDGGTQVDTLSVALHTSKKDFRYVYGLTGYDDNSADKTATGYVELLDLQEGWATIAKVSGVTEANIGKINSVSKADIAKILGNAV